MDYTYVLYSFAKRKFYVGWSSDLRRRLTEHNRGQNKSTAIGRPWKLIYYEAYQKESLAQKREQVFKKRGRVWQSLRKRINPK